MGVVYKARDTRLGRTVALKFLPRHHASNPLARSRLLAEARAASSLDHPNIGVVYEIAEAEDGNQFIAMAWYEGETLKDKIQAAPVSIEEAVAIASQLGSALAAAHRAGIIHRDVKPANVLMTQAATVKLLDFGIAKLMSDETDSLPAAGTIAYMSPEQTRNVGIDTRTDIWSLGVLLYETLTGQRPFKADTDQLIISAIRNEEPAPLSALRPDVPVELARVVERCLSKDAGERYQTVEELCSALSGWRAGVHSTVPSHEDSNPTRSSLPARTRDWLSGISGLRSKIAMALPEGSTLSRVAPSQHTSIAVLGASRGESPVDNEYMIAGLSEELRGELGRIRSIVVPGFLSCENYDARSIPLTTIANELGAKLVVCAEVDRTSPHRQVSLRMVDGQSGETLWSKAYETDSTTLPRIVRDSARNIVTTARIPLTRAETRTLNRVPTNSPTAYDLYLRGRYEELVSLPRRVLESHKLENMRSAQAYYAQARARDAHFAMARASLAKAHMISAATYDNTSARLEQARVEAEAALRLDPAIATAREAMASYWGKTGDTSKAIEELEAGLRITPNSVPLMLSLAWKYLAVGRFEESLTQAERAMKLDPRNPNAAWQVAMTCGRLRRNDKGMIAFGRLISIWPHDHVAKTIKGQSYLRWKGSADTLEAELRTIPLEWDHQGMVMYGRYTVLRVQRKYREALIMLDQCPAELAWDGMVYHPKALMRAEMYEGLEDGRNAEINFELARRFLEEQTAIHPEDPSIHAALGQAYAGLERRAEAVAAAERAMTLAPLSADSVISTAMMGLAVQTFGRVGEHDKAFEMIELLLSMPSGREVTVPFLRVWPGFDPLRNDPRFTQMLQRFTPK